jgi:hypothetical protein
MKKSITSQIINEKSKLFGHQLHKVSRNGLTVDSPFKILPSDNYIDAEVKVITSFLSDYDTVAWDVIDQHIVTIGNKKIDIYEILVSDWADLSKEDWNVNFYFDVSDCI